MIQNTIKILTIGFFISMITGFVLYRSGYFDSTKTSNALQVSPNGGEIYLAQVDQDTTKPPQINQNNAAPIMPSSKSITPVFDAEKHLQKKTRTIMPSSKSGIGLIESFEKADDIKLEKVELKNPYQSTSNSPSFDQDKIDQKRKMEILSSSKSMIYPIEVKPSGTSYGLDTTKQPEPEEKEKEKENNEIAEDSPSEQGESAEQGTNSNESAENESTSINWRGIWIGVLGILFVAVGSIVYFKRRSK